MWLCFGCGAVGCVGGGVSGRLGPGAGGSTQFARGLPNHCDSSTVCRLCRLELKRTTYVGTFSIIIIY